MITKRAQSLNKKKAVAQLKLLMLAQLYSTTTAWRVRYLMNLLPHEMQWRSGAVEG